MDESLQQRGCSCREREQHSSNAGGGVRDSSLCPDSLFVARAGLTELDQVAGLGSQQEAA